MKYFRKIKEHENKIKQKNKGITLVALVITIIILLILAGITLATLTGENGLFVRARQAKQNTLNAQENENLALESYENAINTTLNDSNINKLDKLYIYNNGDENEEVTGGIICSKVNGVYQKNEDNIWLGPGSGGNLQRSKMCTNNKIDTTGYNYLKAELDVENLGTWANRLALYSINGYLSNGDMKVVVGKRPTSIGKNLLITLEISDYQGEYYIGYDIDFYGPVTIYKMWLE